MKSHSVKLSLEIEVDATMENAFHYLTDWPRQEEWMLSTRVEVKSEGDARYVGGKIAAFTGIGPLGFWDSMTITAWQAPQYVEVDHTGKLVRGLGYMRFTALNEKRCRFEWVEILNLPFGFVGRLGFSLLRPIFLFGVRKSLKDFAARAASLA